MTQRFARSAAGRAVSGAAASAVAGALLAWAASCTTFDGLVADPDAGGAGGGPTPWDPPELAYLELDQAVRLCRWVLECDRLADSIIASIAVPVDDENFSQCLHWAAGPIPPDRRGIEQQRALLAGMADAASCDDALGMAYAEVIVPSKDPRCEGKNTRYCFDDVTAVDCSKELSGLVNHCDSPRFAPVAHACVLGGCILEGETCSLGRDPEFWCTDEVGYLCIAPVVAGGSCTLLGLTCANDFTCGPGPNTIRPCTALGETSCLAEDEDVVNVCSGLFDSEFRCEEIEGGTCATTGKARCSLPTDVCTPIDDIQNSCNGTQLTACVGGQHIVFDCASVGLECLPRAGDKSGRCGSAP